MQEVKNESDARLANREKKPTSDLSAANFSPVSIPLEVLDILKRPASIWSQEQRNAVLLFFFCDVQSLACLCAFTNKKLRKMGLACEETDIVIDHLFEKLQSTKTNINFDQAHDKAKESDLAKKFFAYLCGSIRNAVCNLARNREGHTVVLSIQMQGEPPVRGGIDPNLVDMQNQGNTPLHRQDPSHRLAVYQDHHAIKMMREEIEKLPDKQCFVVKKFYFEGWKHKKIANELRTTANSTRSLLSQALPKLKQKLEKAGYTVDNLMFELSTEIQFPE